MLLYFCHTDGTGTNCAKALCSNQTGLTEVLVVTTTVWLLGAVTLFQPLGTPPPPAKQYGRGELDELAALMSDQSNSTFCAVTGCPFDQCQLGFMLMVNTVSWWLMEMPDAMDFA